MFSSGETTKINPKYGGILFCNDIKLAESVWFLHFSSWTPSYLQFNQPFSDQILNTSAKFADSTLKKLPSPAEISYAHISISPPLGYTQSISKSSYRVCYYGWPVQEIWQPFVLKKYDYNTCSYFDVDSITYQSTGSSFASLSIHVHFSDPRVRLRRAPHQLL